MNTHEFLMTLITILLTLFSRPPQIQVLGGAALLPPISQAPAPSPCLCSDNYTLIFADQRLATVYPVIQKFKSLITLDPFNVTATWVGSDICSYTGFYCESPPDNKSALTLASIDFNGFQLTAPTLDGFIDQLPDIALFHANTNNFGGTIPSNIANLPYLYEFDISNNRFSGPFPDAVLTVQALSFLDLRFNSFSGSVPPQLFTNDLDALFLNNNNFMSRLPQCIGRSSSHLILLTLANNKFFGPIPRNFYKALSGNLTEILLFNNRLTGCLPYELGLLKEVIVFDAGNNYLTGPLPYSLGCLQNLEILNFAGNLLYGHVPEVLCRLGNLANLSLSNNYFTGFGHSCWRLIKNGVLDLKKNCIPGLPMQRSFDECVDFFSYYPIHYCPHFPVHYHMYMSCGIPPWENYGLGIHELATPPSN